MPAHAEEPVILGALESQGVRAIIDRLIPADSDPGAVALGIDEQIVEQVAASPSKLADLRAALRALDAAAQRLGGERFAALDPEQQDELLRRWQRNDLPAAEGAGTAAPQIFRQLRADVVAAYYRDPRVWPLVGYPGYSMPHGYPDGGPCGARLEER